MSEVPELIAAMDSALYSESIPLALAVHWEQEGPAAWAACEDPRPLLRILVVADPRLAARVAAACARTASSRLGPDHRAIAASALDAADAWGRGESDGADCYAEGRAATKRAHELAHTDAKGACALYAATHAAFVVRAWSTNARSGAADHAGLAAQAAASDAYDAEPDETALRRLADLVRSMAACPTPRVPTD